ncbi:MAG: ATP-binding protein, partial [Gammaproteobacteria bacterium]
SEFPAVASISKLDLGSEKIFTVALRDITDEQEAEKQRRQAQKMEAVGQLTGGIAHDFNNLLTVILGNLQMLDEQFTADDDSRQMTTTALKAVFRGADLTKRLLTFSRQQILEPIVIDINQLVWKMNDLLRRTLGEAIEVKTNFADELWPTLLDPGQLENSLLNLSINARDAMPDGGMLTLETANIQLDEHYCAKHSWVSPGDYVMLAVSDVGEGIAPEIQDRVFEPFFTTKDTGRGSGLGLSMVYGFVKQSGGHVNIYSEQGHGTTIKLYFPKTKTRQAVTEAQAELEVTPRGNETILVVEDDIDVRRTATILLKMLGYRVLEAENGRTALAVIEQHEEIDLMFTDVVMPGGMKGPEVVARARQIRPHLKALLTSGYTQSAMQNDDMSDSGIEVLSKPYNKNDLARKIRKVLDGK